MLALAGLIVFWTLVAPSLALRFNFTDVQQCDPLAITFDGNLLNSSKADNVPHVLTILPINSTAIVFPLADPNVVSLGIGLTFLPFPAGSNFIASLDNELGDNLISTSDIIRVLPSSSNNITCLPSQTIPTRRFFSVASNPSQCENLTVTYDKSVILEAPNVRLYSPKGPSFKLKLLSDDPSAGVATYLMNYPRSQQILLMMDDGVNIRETSTLYTVLGDSSSDKSCLNFISGSGDSGSSDSTDPGSDAVAPSANDGTPVASRAVIIGGAAGGGAVLLIGICMALFVLRDRRKRRQQSSSFSPSRMEKTSGPVSPSDLYYNEKTLPLPHSLKKSFSPRKGSVMNPIYTSAAFLTPNKRSTRGSLTSWAQAIPEDQKYPPAASSGYPLPTYRAINTPKATDAASLESLDIEGMLNMATMQSEISSRNETGVPLFRTIVSATPVTVPGPSLQPPPRTRHQRGPSDVPADYASEFSLNPFELNSMRGSILPGTPAYSRESGVIRFSCISNLQPPDILPSTGSHNNLDLPGGLR